MNEAHKSQSIFTILSRKILGEHECELLYVYEMWELADLSWLLAVYFQCTSKGTKLDVSLWTCLYERNVLSCRRSVNITVIFKPNGILLSYWSVLPVQTWWRWSDSCAMMVRSSTAISRRLTKASALLNVFDMNPNCPDNKSCSWIFTV